MRPEDKERLELWKKETLSEVTSELAAKSEEFRSRPLADFNAFASTLGKKAGAGFMKAFGFTSEDEVNAMPFDVKYTYAAFIVSAINAGLTVDHPYLAALVFSDPTPQVRMCVLDRKAVPGAHDFVTRGIVPILRITDTPLGQRRELYFRTVDVEHFNPRDNLEDLYRL